MIGRIVEIADVKRYLSVERGFMVVHSTDRATNGERAKLGQVPLDDITAVIANAHGISYTNNLLVALAERNAPLVVCGANHNAVSMLLPIEGNYQQAKRFDAQIAASKPTHKRVWALIVKAKLQQQANVLASMGANAIPLQALVEQVKSGDTGNLEAIGARRYWQTLLGSDFRRDQGSAGLNSLLNYGYTVLRAATARALVAAGLHPTLGVHHSNEGNAMRLVDDLMEPFRPCIDRVVWQCKHAGTIELTPDVKKQLVQALYTDLPTASGNTPVLVCVQKLATSLALLYLGERQDLDLPLPTIAAAWLGNDEDG
jgi:CRISPR-associated protein Cas1